MLPELRLHYRTVGTPQRDATGRVRNAVHRHARHGRHRRAVCRARLCRRAVRAGPTARRREVLRRHARRIGHGKSSKPSDGLRAKFPRYGYQDMVRAQYLLMTEALGASRLRLVMGTSMGGMHTWVWGETYPDAMDALMPLASLPDQISGTQSCLAARGDRCHPDRPELEGRQLHDAAARPAHGCADAVARGQQSRHPAEAGADAGRRRPRARRVRGRTT